MWLGSRLPPWLTQLWPVTNTHTVRAKRILLSRECERHTWDQLCLAPSPSRPSIDVISMAPPTRGSAREDRIESRHFYYCHIAVDTHMGSGYTLYTRRNERSECKQSWKVCLSDALVRLNITPKIQSRISSAVIFFC